MEIPRHWRMRKQRYTLDGFPPMRPTKPTMGPTGYRERNLYPFNQNQNMPIQPEQQEQTPTAEQAVSTETQVKLPIKAVAIPR